MELQGASFHDKELRRKFVPRMLEWHRVVHDAVKEFIAESGLELPVSSQAIAAWIGWFWMGMEASMALDIPEEKGHQREALEAVTTLLRRAGADLATIVGISAAAMPAIRLAAQQPARASRLVLCGGWVKRKLDPAVAEARQQVVHRMREQWPAYLDEFFSVVFSEPHATTQYEDGVRAGTSPGWRSECHAPIAAAASGAASSHR